MSDELKVERRGSVLVVTIDRQERMNALSQEVHDDLLGDVDLAEGRSARCGRSSSPAPASARSAPGMDLKAFAERGGPRPVKADVHEELRLTPLHCDVWLPTIVAVNGVCTGAGLHFVADADVVVASSTASLPRHARERGPGRRDRADHAAAAHRARQRAAPHGARPARPDRCRRGAADLARRRGRRARRSCSTARSSSPSWPRRVRRPRSRRRSGRSAARSSGRWPRRCSTAGSCCSRTASTPTATRARRRSPRSGSRSGSDRRRSDADLDAVVAEVERFLRELLPADWVAAIDAGRPRRARGASAGQLDPDERVAAHRRAPGYVAPTWPEEYGGLGVDPQGRRRRSRARSARYKMPRFNNPVGVDLVGPGHPAVGHRRAEAAVRRPIARVTRTSGASCSPSPAPAPTSPGWRRRAVRDGDTWIVQRSEGVDEPGRHRVASGSCSRGPIPTCRSTRGSPRSCCRWTQPGVTVRPLRQITGDAEFSEVFFDDVARRRLAAARAGRRRLAGRASPC